MVAATAADAPVLSTATRVGLVHGLVFLAGVGPGTLGFGVVTMVVMVVMMVVVRSVTPGAAAGTPDDEGRHGADDDQQNTQHDQDVLENEGARLDPNLGSDLLHLSSFRVLCPAPRPGGPRPAGRGVAYGSARRAG